MVYVTGDCHGYFDKFSKRRFKAQKWMTHDDFVIICGDFGGVWKGDDYEGELLDYLNNKSFTTLFVEGNHENFDMLYNKFAEVDFHGGKAHKIRDHVYHLMRGYVFDLCGKKFFAFGGASSHDIEDGILDTKDYATERDFLEKWRSMSMSGKRFRVKGVSWWPEELPSTEEMNRGVESLQVCDYKVDFVITHCLPSSIQSYISFGQYDTDCLTDYLQQLIDSGLQFEGFYSGHYHTDEDVLDKFHIMYNKIRRIV